MSDTILGTCSLCGGPVTVPHAWLGTSPPLPECKHCHARPRRPYGPVIDMQPRMTGETTARDAFGRSLHERDYPSAFLPPIQEG